MVDIGLVATPMLYFGVDQLGVGGGVMVTASHNPAEYNGFKVCGRHAVPVGEASGLREIEKLAGEDAPPSGAPGAVRSADVGAAYVEQLLSMTEVRPALHAVIDCGNGMAASASSRCWRGCRCAPSGSTSSPTAFPEPPRGPARRREPRGPAARGAAQRAPTSASPSTATATARSSSTSTPSRCPRTW